MSDGPVPTPPVDERGMRRDVRLLFLCQALMQSAITGQVAMSALVGHSLATDKSLNTLPMALQMLATMAASIPAGIIFARLGRRWGFVLGAVASLLGSLTFALGVYRADFVLYCAGAVPAGIGFGIAQYYRFAAAEVATPAYRARAVSLVMAGGVVSGLLGPELVKHTGDLLAPYLFLATYLCLALLPVGCLILLRFVRLPPAPPRARVATPVLEIITRPVFVAAAVTGLVAYGTMNLVMASTPVEMLLCGFGVSASASVIQWHAFAMFAPGFVTGRIIARVGVRPVIVAGAALSAACVLVGVLGHSFWHFIAALMLLGVGWNFMFVGATNLLAGAHRPEERVRAQAANDFIVFGTVACTALLSGYVHARAGWAVLNLSLLPPLVVAVALLLWQRLRAGRAAVALA